MRRNSRVSQRPDPLSPSQRSALMSKVRNCGNLSTEVAVEAALASVNIRGWTKHPPGVTGRPDFFFPRYKLAVFVDGCFWHACPSCARNLPTRRRRFWESKIDGNRRRDNRVRKALRQRGFAVMRIWEHSVGDSLAWLRRLTAIIRRRRAR